MRRNRPNARFPRFGLSCRFRPLSRFSVFPLISHGHPRWKRDREYVCLPKPQRFPCFDSPLGIELRFFSPRSQWIVKPFGIPAAGTQPNHGCIFKNLSGLINRQKGHRGHPRRPAKIPAPVQEAASRPFLTRTTRSSNRPQRNSSRLFRNLRHHFQKSVRSHFWRRDAIRKRGRARNNTSGRIFRDLHAPRLSDKFRRIQNCSEFCRMLFPTNFITKV